MKYNLSKFLLSGSKIILPFIILVLMSLYGGCSSGTYDSRRDTGYEDEYNSYGNENDVLDRYGDWINIAPYGTVWRPFVSNDWQPYSYGHWIATENGWTWVSYEPFGWITYHYGYWNFQPEVGWFWIESNDWSPARVQWADYGDYIGWAPLPPPGYSLPEPGMYNQVHVWNVINVRDFTRENLWKYRLRDQLELNNFGNIPRRLEGPDVRVVERYTNQPVNVIRTRREIVNVNGRQFNRMVLPEGQRAVIRKYEPQVNGTIVRTRGDQRTRDNAGNRNTRIPNNTGNVAPPANPNGNVGTDAPNKDNRPQRNRQGQPGNPSNGKPVERSKAPGVENRTSSPNSSSPGTTEQGRSPRGNTPEGTRNNGERQKGNRVRTEKPKVQKKEKINNPDKKDDSSKDDNSKEGKTERQRREDTK